MWSELTWFMWSDFVFKWSVVQFSKVSYGEVLGDKSTMYIRVTLYSGYLIVLWLFHSHIAKEFEITPVLDKLLEYKRNWIQHVNRMPRDRLPQDNETLFPNWQNESWQTSEETSTYVRPERVNKLPNSMTDIWWWWWWWWWWCILYCGCFNLFCIFWVSVCGGVLTIVWVFW